MTTSAGQTPLQHQCAESLAARLAYPAIAPFIIGAAVALACYIVSGVSLGLFFGPMLILTFVAPSLAMGERSGLQRLTLTLALTAGSGVVWFLLAHLPASDLGRCVAVLLAYLGALVGLASLFERIRVGKTFAAGVTALLGLLWLTWPVWLCPWLNGPHAQGAVNDLTIAHPIMAMNAVLFARFNFWDRYTIAYQQLTILNQDLLYELPKTICWMVIAHGAVGVLGLLAIRRHPPASKPG